MKKTRLVGLASLLPIVAAGWISAATSSDKDPSIATRAASEYVYLHQTRNAASALQKASDRSALQCVPD